VTKKLDIYFEFKWIAILLIKCQNLKNAVYRELKIKVTI
jgi:hypothetical protein